MIAGLSTTGVQAVRQEQDLIENPEVAKHILQSF
jgi:hypothetical protein